MSDALDRFETGWDLSIAAGVPLDNLQVQKVLRDAIKEPTIQVLRVAGGLDVYATTPIERYGRLVQGEGESALEAARSLCTQIDELSFSLYARFNDAVPHDASTKDIEDHLTALLRDRTASRPVLVFEEFRNDLGPGSWIARMANVVGRGSSPMEAARVFLLQLEVLEGSRPQPKTRFEVLLAEPTV